MRKRRSVVQFEMYTGHRLTKRCISYYNLCGLTCNTMLVVIVNFMLTLFLLSHTITYLVRHYGVILFKEIIWLSGFRFKLEVIPIFANQYWLHCIDRVREPASLGDPIPVPLPVSVGAIVDNVTEAGYFYYDLP